MSKVKTAAIGRKSKTNGANGNGRRASSVEPKLVGVPAILDADVAKLSKFDQVFRMIEEARQFMYQESLALAAAGGPNDEDAARRLADAFLNSAFRRLDLVVKPNPHSIYARDLGVLRRRLDGVRHNMFGYERPRLDELIEGLVYEARLLMDAQTTMCQHCEHCIRENPELVDGELKVREPLSDELVDHLIRMFDDREFEAKHLLAFARHLEALALNGRPGRVSAVVDELALALAGTDDVLKSAAAARESAWLTEIESERQRFIQYDRENAE